MLVLLSEAGRSFLRVFVGALVILLPGVLSAPNLSTVAGLAVSAVIAAIVAGLKAVQVFVPQLSFKNVPRVGVYYVYLDSFVRAFLGTLISALIGVLSLPSLSLGRAVIVGLLVGAVTAGVRAVQGLLTQGEPPAPATGLVVRSDLTV